MTGLGSATWCEERLAAGAALPGGSGGDAVLSFTASGGPDGDVSWHERLAGGRLVAVAPGAAPDADVAVTIPWADAEAVFAGTLDANAAYMQGRLKSTGATGPLLLWLAARKAAPGA